MLLGGSFFGKNSKSLLFVGPIPGRSHLEITVALHLPTASRRLTPRSHGVEDEEGGGPKRPRSLWFHPSLTPWSLAERRQGLPKQPGPVDWLRTQIGPPVPSLTKHGPC